MNAWRSKLSAIACRRSGLSKGGLSRLTIRPRLRPTGPISHSACGIWFFMTLSSGTVRLYGKVMSNFPETAANTAVDRFLMIVYSTPSR
jgi:hypothetical protein